MRDYDLEQEYCARCHHLIDAHSWVCEADCTVPGCGCPAFVDRMLGSLLDFGEAQPYVEVVDGVRILAVNSTTAQDAPETTISTPGRAEGHPGA